MERKKKFSVQRSAFSVQRSALSGQCGWFAAGGAKKVLFLYVPPKDMCPPMCPSLGGTLAFGSLSSRCLVMTYSVCVGERVITIVESDRTARRRKLPKTAIGGVRRARVQRNIDIGDFVY